MSLSFQVFFIFIFVVSAFFSDGHAGSKTGADFLKIPVSARGLGLGQAYTALAEGSEAMHWNTAGIVPTQSAASAPSSLSVSHQELFFGNNLDHLSVAMPRKNSTIGLSMIRLSYPDQEGRDEQRNETGSFGASDLAVGLALGTKVQGVRLGTQVKFVRQQLANQETTGFAFDLGIMSRTPINKLQLGAAINNLGPAMKFANDTYSLPMSISVGAAFNVMGPLTVGLDIKSLVRQKQTTVAIGSEFVSSDFVVLRAGYLAKLATAITNNQKSETDRGSFGGLSGMNAGLGLKFSRLTIDYALSPFGELGEMHTFSLSTSFGGKSSSEDTPTDSPAPNNRQIIIFN